MLQTKPLHMDARYTRMSVIIGYMVKLQHALTKINSKDTLQITGAEVEKQDTLQSLARNEEIWRQLGHAKPPGRAKVNASPSRKSISPLSKRRLFFAKRPWTTGTKNSEDTTGSIHWWCHNNLQYLQDFPISESTLKTCSTPAPCIYMILKE